MRIKIVSGGTAATTHIYDELGNEIKEVVSVEVEIHPLDIVKARLTFFVEHLDIVAVADDPEDHA